MGGYQQQERHARGWLPFSWWWLAEGATTCNSQRLQVGLESSWVVVKSRGKERKGVEGEAVVGFAVGGGAIGATSVPALSWGGGRLRGKEGSVGGRRKKRE